MNSAKVSSACVVEFANLDGSFVEIIEQARVDAHFAEVLAKGLPMRAAAANRAVMNADHSVAPHIGSGLAADAYLLWRKISNAPCEAPTKGAVTVRNPFWPAWQFYLHVAAVAASVNAHRDLVFPVCGVRN